jgi:hypothetical protein
MILSFCSDIAAVHLCQGSTVTLGGCSTPSSKLLGLCVRLNNIEHCSVASCSAKHEALKLAGGVKVAGHPALIDQCHWHCCSKCMTAVARRGWQPSMHMCTVEGAGNKKKWWQHAAADDIIIIIIPCKPYLSASAPRLTLWGGGN